MRSVSTTPTRDARIAALASVQHGVVSRRQLLEVGLDRFAIARRIRAGRLHPIHRGVYAVGHPTLTREARYLAAVLACGDGAVLSHRSAAALWGLVPSGAASIEVTVPLPSGFRSTEAIRVHRSRRPTESTTRAAVPVTTPARTLADLAETATARALEKAVEVAEQQRLLDAVEIAAVAADRPGRAGPRRLVRVLETHDTDHTTRSELEDAFLELCDRHGIPRPAVNARVAGYEVDFCWPAERLIVETDGFRFHGSRRAFAADRARDRRLTAAGWRVARVAGAEIHGTPRDVAADVLRLLEIAHTCPPMRYSPAPAVEASSRGALKSAADALSSTARSGRDPDSAACQEETPPQRRHGL
jgi:predicted transcriptional regulator of viral defense system